MNFTTAQYPGLDNGENATYSEGLLVGYRYYNHHKITPKFAFGLGLSYTTFTYANLQISEDKYGGYRVTVEVANTGKVAGVETPQLYMEHPAAAGEPPKQLRGFQKIALAAGEARSVNFRLAARDFSIWDVKTHDWKASAGTFGVHIGASSEDIRASGQIKKTDS
jgi:beta-glucosidase